MLDCSHQYTALQPRICNWILERIFESLFKSSKRNLQNECKKIQVQKGCAAAEDNQTGYAEAAAMDV